MPSGTSTRSPPSRRSHTLPGNDPGERRLEPLELLGDVQRTIVAEASRPQDEVGPIEIHAEPTPSSCEAVGYPAPEILEEVLQLVALGQTLDQLDLPDRDAGLARDRHREIAFLLGERALGVDAGREKPEQLARREQRHEQRRTAPSPAPNRAAARVAPASRRSPRRPPARSDTSEGASLDCGAAARSRSLPSASSSRYSWTIGAFSRLAVRLTTAGSSTSSVSAREIVSASRESDSSTPTRPHISS